MNPAKLVVAYVRVSTSEQDKHGYGIRIQRRDVQAFAQSNKLKIDRFYTERAETGVLWERTALQKLLRECERGVVGTVIIPSIHRFARTVRISENLFWELQEIGVKVLIADMPTYSVHDPQTVFMRQIHAAVAEQERKDIIRKLLKGRQERVRNGRPAGGMVPYGYARRRKRFVPHPVESQIVRKIFEMSDSGISLADIASDLNKLGYRRRNRQEWTRGQVRAIFGRRDLYRNGKLRYGKITATNHKLILLETGGDK